MDSTDCHSRFLNVKRAQLWIESDEKIGISRSLGLVQPNSGTPYSPFPRHDNNKFEGKLLIFENFDATVLLLVEPCRKFIHYHPTPTTNLRTYPELTPQHSPTLTMH